MVKHFISRKLPTATGRRGVYTSPTDQDGDETPHSANGMAHGLLGGILGDEDEKPILTSGTRDLLLSNTVRVHRKLRQAGVEAYLQIFEGQSHGQYQLDDSAPETKEAFAEISAFFDKHMAK